MVPNLYTQAAKNSYKTWVLMTTVFLVVIALGWFFAYYFQDPSLVYIFAIFAIVLNITSYWYSDKIVLKLAGARPATREEFFDLYTVVENLSITAGLPMPKIYVIDDSAPNAFATGRDKEHAVVCATTGLLAILNRSELEGVMAHELSHIGNKDMLLSTVVVVSVGFISILSNVFLRSMWWGGGKSSNDRDNGGSILMIIGLVLAILAPIVGTLMQLAISRRREYLADASGALLTRYPEGLANALKKIGEAAQPMRHQSGVIAHLYLADPTAGKKTPMLSKLFMTHPPIADRIAALLGKKNELESEIQNEG